MHAKEILDIWEKVSQKNPEFPVKTNDVITTHTFSGSALNITHFLMAS